VGEPERWAAAAHRFADALVELGGHDEEALELYREALNRREDVGDVNDRILTHLALGDLYTGLGRPVEAGEQCRLAAALVNENQHLPAAMKLHTVLARLRHAEGDDRVALQHAHRAVELADRSQRATGQARASATLAQILYDCGNLPDARALWEQAAELYRGRSRVAKAERIEALLAELDVGELPIPLAREGGRDTVAMPSPRMRITHRSGSKVSSGVDDV
jgi:tetratricopeptide (TPR) repeat protein